MGLLKQYDLGMKDMVMACATHMARWCSKWGLKMDRPRFALASLILPFMLWPIVFLQMFTVFWIGMTAATLILLTTSLLLIKQLDLKVSARWLFLGVLSGFLLYSFFYAGFQVTRGLESFSGGVASVYAFRTDFDITLIALLLIFPIAPAEEIYWRGLIQKFLTTFFNPTIGLLLTTALYTLIHAFTLNPPLLITAMIGGLVWGYLYKRSKNLLPGVVSHVVFNLMIFVVAPFT
ncbi:MAG: CPBP family intramembrane metalloprotease [Thaumarchaeota archaeon]|nr:CPBP family intramembrane metalloprotease [Nitrososphaerota archaeon]